MVSIYDMRGEINMQVILSNLSMADLQLIGGGRALEPGRFAYERYLIHANHTNFIGRPLPTWDDLGERQQGIWRATAADCFEEGAARSRTEAPKHDSL
jgi:hypothetical protein